MRSDRSLRSTEVELRAASADVTRTQCNVETIDVRLNASQREDVGERDDSDAVRSRLRLRPEHVAPDRARVCERLQARAFRLRRPRPLRFLRVRSSQVFLPAGLRRRRAEYL